MPRIFGGKDARQAFKKGKPELAAENTVCYLQILGVGTDCNDAMPSVLLFFDRQRYLFNAGEGFQRFCVEHKIKMNRVSSCLLTRLTGDAAGGLPGMCLTMADAGVSGPSRKPQLDIVGPSGLQELASAARSFISSSAVGINALEFGPEPQNRLPPPPPLPLRRPNPTPQYPQLGPIPTMKPLFTSESKQLKLSSPDGTTTGFLSPPALPASPVVAADPSSRFPDDPSHRHSSAQAVGSFALPPGPGAKASWLAGGVGLPPPPLGSPAIPKPIGSLGNDLEDSEMPQAEEAPAPSPLIGSESPAQLGSPAVSEAINALKGDSQMRAGDPPAKSLLLSSEASGVSLQSTDLLGKEKVQEGSDARGSPSQETGSATPVVAVASPQGATASPKIDQLQTRDRSSEGSPIVAAPSGSAGLRRSSVVPAGPDQPLEPIVQNDLLNITPILLNPSAPAQTPAERPENGSHPKEDPAASTPAEQTKEDGDAAAEERPTKKQRVEGDTVTPTPTARPSGFSINGEISYPTPQKLPAAAYVCELTKVPGRFLPDKAMELGVPKGEMFAILKSGKSVTLENGSVVEAHLVNEPHHPGPVAVIVDCPDQDYLPSLLEAPIWKRFWQQDLPAPADAADPIKAVDVMCHLAPVEIVEAEQYQVWIERFGDSTQHIYVNSKATGGAPIMTSSAAIQARLNCVHPTLFPMHSHLLPSGDASPMEGVTEEGRAPADDAGQQESSSQPTPEDTAVNGRLPLLLTSGSVEREMVAAASDKVKVRKSTSRAQSVEASDGTKSSGEKPGTSGEAVEGIVTTLAEEAAASGTALGTADAAAGDAPQEGFRGVRGRRPGSHPRVRVQAFRVKTRHVAGQNLLKLHLRPPTRRGCFDDSELPKDVDFKEVQKEVRERQDLMAAVDKAKEIGKAVDTGRGHSALIQKLGPRNLEVVFLGTGAAIPSKYRNVTGIYFDLFDRGGMMVDCGEGSYGQLKRKYGPRAEEVVKGLRCIWISHIHADHHAGLTRYYRILSLRKQLLGEGCPPLLVLGPRALHRVLDATAHLQNLACHFIDSSQTVARHPGPKDDADKEVMERAYSQLGISKLESFTVDHCANAYGLQLESVDGWKVVFSGDTRPCMNVVQAAKNALILIHEATFEDALEMEAVNKKHSLTCEAVEVGFKAKAYRTVLTHFSQRYPKIPVIDSSFQTTTCIAFDLMTVNLVDLPVLPWLVEPIRQLFYGENLFEEAEEESAEAAVEQPSGPAAVQSVVADA